MLLITAAVTLMRMRTKISFLLTRLLGPIFIKRASNLRKVKSNTVRVHVPANKFNGIKQSSSLNCKNMWFTVPLF